MENDLLNECKRVGIRLEIFVDQENINMSLHGESDVIFECNHKELKDCVNDCLIFIKDLGL